MTLIRRFSTRAARALSCLAVALCAAAGFGAAPAHAGPVGFQAAGGWYTEGDDFFLNVGARFGAATVTVIPNLDWMFVDNGTARSFNVDGTMTVMPLGVGSGYLGAGLGWRTVDPDHGDSNTDMVWNVLAGFGLNSLPLKPFGQLKYVIVDGNDPLVFSLGVRF
jgi:hypothetical protein